MLQCGALTLQTLSLSQAPKKKLTQQQLEVVAGASDPFRFVRLILYGIFGFVGVVGAGLALSKGDVANAGVNGLFFVGAGGAYFVDLKVQGALLDKAKEEVENPYLKGVEEILEEEKKDP